jgi:hypothetical protein
MIKDILKGLGVLVIGIAVIGVWTVTYKWWQIHNTEKMLRSAKNGQLVACFNRVTESSSLVVSIDKAIVVEENVSSDKFLVGTIFEQGLLGVHGAMRYQEFLNKCWVVGVEERNITIKRLIDDMIESMPLILFPENQSPESSPSNKTYF